MDAEVTQRSTTANCWIEHPPDTIVAIALRGAIDDPEMAVGKLAEAALHLKLGHCAEDGSKAVGERHADKAAPAPGSLDDLHQLPGCTGRWLLKDYWDVGSNDFQGEVRDVLGGAHDNHQIGLRSQRLLQAVAGEKSVSGGKVRPGSRCL